MHTRLAILALFGIWLIVMPHAALGATSRAAQVGWASWYGTYHQGRKTASGERFSRTRLTAAHRSLPLGTRVRVTNLRTGQHVVVTINDRGPHSSGKRRILDLSEAAAKRIGLTPRGVELMRIVVVDDAS
jgi:rare lipoprotein A